MLAQLYELGLVDDKIELDVAFDLYLEATVEGGDLTAMGIVGDYYKEGKGKVEKNLNEAKKWYLKIINYKEDDFKTIINNNEVTGKDAILTAQSRLEEVEKIVVNAGEKVYISKYCSEQEIRPNWLPKKFKEELVKAMVNFKRKCQYLSKKKNKIL